MTTPKIPTVKKNDSRLYVWEKEQYQGVTSVVGMLPKPFLQYWAAKKVAEAAVERGTVTERDIDWLKAAPRRDLNQAADTGTNVHERLDSIINKEDVDITEEEAPFIEGFNQFVDKCNPEWVMTEQTVLGFYGDLGYAGSFDAIANIHSESWLIDFKTTRSGVHPEVALQLAAYANAREVIHPDGSTQPVPKIDRCGVLWLRPDNWQFVELKATQDPDDPCFHTFGALLRSWHWDNGGSKKALGSVQVSGVSYGNSF